MPSLVVTQSVPSREGGNRNPLITALQRHPQFIQTLAQLGEKWDVDDILLDELQAFTCVIYGRPKFMLVDSLRYYMLQEKCSGEQTINSKVNIDLASFPPCYKSLKQHARRANFQTAIWKRAHAPTPDIPKPNEGHGWHLSKGMLQPLWTEEEEELQLPESIIDDSTRETQSTDDEDSENIDKNSDDTDIYDFESDAEEDEYPNW